MTTNTTIIRDAFAGFPRSMDPRGRRTVTLTEGELFRRVAILVDAAQRRTATQAHAWLRKDVARVN